MTRGRRAQVLVSALLTAGLAAGLYLAGGIGAAAIGLVLGGIVASLGRQFTPQLPPPPVSAISKPPQGTGVEATRKRQIDRIGSLALLIPWTVAGALIAAVAGPDIAQVAGAVVAVLSALGIVFILWITSGRAHAWDRRRLARYERMVARLEERRRIYRALVERGEIDPAAEREKEAQLGRLLAAMHGAPVSVRKRPRKPPQE